MINYKAPSYHQKRHSEFLQDRDLRLAWSYFADRTYFSHVRSGDRVLDFGGGLGNNLLVVKERAEVLMLEPSDLGRKVANEDGITTVATSEELDGRSFDTILCRHVLEHVDDPKSVLEDLRNKLSPDGRLILVVPCEHWNTPSAIDDVDHHLYCWNPRTLSNLLRRAGFEVDQVRYEFFGAKRRLMPVFHALSGRHYAALVRAVGRLCRFRELVVEALPACPYPDRNLVEKHAVDF